MKDKLTTVLGVTFAIAMAALAFGVAPAHATQVTSKPYAVTSGKAKDGRPDLAGQTLVWQAKSGADWNIYCATIDPATRTAGPVVPVCTDPGDQIDPRVSVSADGHVLIVWEDHRNGNADIYGYDLTTGKGFVVCDQAAAQVGPRISGDWVVWSDHRNGTWDIYGATIDTATDTVAPAAPICDEVHDQTQPDVSGDTVVWVDTRYGDQDILAYDRVSGETFPVCLDGATQDQPAVSGDTVVWRDARNAATTGTDIYGFSLLTMREFPVCAAAGDQSAPAIDHDVVVWTDARSAKTGLDVRGYDLVLQEPFPVLVAGGAQGRPVVSDSRVVWGDARSGVVHIWAAGLTPWDARMTVDSGQAWTRSTTARLALRARSHTGVVVQMTLASTGGSGVVYDYWPTQRLYLTPGDGLKHVTAVFTDLSGASSPTVSAQITLDTHGPTVHVPAATTIASGAKGSIAFRVTDNLAPAAAVVLRVLNAHGEVAKAFVAARLTTGTVHHFAFVCHLKPGTYHVRVGATDLAGNHQVKVATGTLTVS